MLRQAASRLAPLLSSTATSSSSLRCLATGASPAEQAIEKKLREGIKGIKAIEVQDTSGGCGAMYRIVVEADDFK